MTISDAERVELAISWRALYNSGRPDGCKDEPIRCARVKPWREYKNLGLAAQNKLLHELVGVNGTPRKAVDLTYQVFSNATLKQIQDKSDDAPWPEFDRIVFDIDVKSKDHPGKTEGELNAMRMERANKVYGALISAGYAAHSMAVVNTGVSGYHVYLYHTPARAPSYAALYEAAAAKLGISDIVDKAASGAWQMIRWPYTLRHNGNVCMPIIPNSKAPYIVQDNHDIDTPQKLKLLLSDNLNPHTGFIDTLDYTKNGKNGKAAGGKSGGKGGNGKVDGIKAEELCAVSMDGEHVRKWRDKETGKMQQVTVTNAPHDVFINAPCISGMFEMAAQFPNADLGMDNLPYHKRYHICSALALVYDEDSFYRIVSRIGNYEKNKDEMKWSYYRGDNPQKKIYTPYGRDKGVSEGVCGGKRCPIHEADGKGIVQYMREVLTKMRGGTVNSEFRKKEVDENMKAKEYTDGLNAYEFGGKVWSFNGKYYAEVEVGQGATEWQTVLSDLYGEGVDGEIGYDDLKISTQQNIAKRVAIIQNRKRIKHDIKPHFNERYISFNNGELDLKTMKLNPHSPARFHIHQIPHDYTDYRIAWRKMTKYRPFLHDLLLGQDGKERVKVGYQYWSMKGQMLSPNRSLQYAWWIKSPTRTGKSTDVEIMVNALGEANCGSAKLDKLIGKDLDPFMIVTLSHFLCNIGDDENLIWRKDTDTSMLNTLYVGGRTTTRAMRQVAKHTRINATFVHTMNDKLAGLVKGLALARRIQLISLYGKQYRGKDVILDYSSTFDDEFGYIASYTAYWAAVIRGWQPDPEGKQYVGIRYGITAEEALDELLDDNDSEVRQAFDDLFVRDKDAYTPLKDIKSALSVWLTSQYGWKDDAIEKAFSKYGYVTRYLNTEGFKHAKRRRVMIDGTKQPRTVYMVSLRKDPQERFDGKHGKTGGCNCAGVCRCRKDKDDKGIWDD